MAKTTKPIALPIPHLRKNGPPPPWTEPPAREQQYRCPVCGEMVDASDFQAYSAHHRHILRPDLLCLRNTG